MGVIEKELSQTMFNWNDISIKPRTIKPNTGILNRSMDTTLNTLTRGKNTISTASRYLDISSSGSSLSRKS